MSQGGPQEPKVAKSEMQRPREPCRVVYAFRARQFLPAFGPSARAGSVSRRSGGSISHLESRPPAPALQEGHPRAPGELVERIPVD